MKNLNAQAHACSAAARGERFIPNKVEGSRITDLCILCVRAYQVTLSPEHGIVGYVLPYRACRFFPTCSEYAIEALRQYGLFRGLMVSLKRILRCHPWHAGGYDPLKHNTQNT
ncbi:MAG: membrane protein insertion efficiency factor YidD [Candidatus Sungbacteria bacterium]|nr:membrane protein insertion efficiency factor YidD [Candidatus Sungbacteria bacterium]